MELLHLNSTISSADKYNGKTVQDIIETAKKGTIFQLIKRGYMFDDEVLKLCNITKTIRDRRTYNVISEHAAKDTKKYKKDTATLKEILKEINTIERETYGDEKENAEKEANEKEITEQEEIVENAE